MNVLCAICNEALNSSGDMCTTPCGHVFHYTCLSRWLERSPTCPECRRRTTMNTVRKLYFNVNPDNSPKLDTQELQIMLDEIISQNKELEKTNSELSSKLQISEEKVKQIEEKYLNKEAAFNVVKQQYDHCLQKYTEIEDLNKKQCTEIEDLKKKFQYCQERIVLLRRMVGSLEKTTNEFDSMITRFVKPSDLVEELKGVLASNDQKCKNLEEAFQHSQLKIMKLKSELADCEKHFESYMEEEKIKELEIKKKSLIARITVLDKIRMGKETVCDSENISTMPRRPLENLQNIDKRRLNIDNDQHSSLKKSRLADPSASSTQKA